MCTKCVVSTYTWWPGHKRRSSTCETRVCLLHNYLLSVCYALQSGVLQLHAASLSVQVAGIALQHPLVLLQ
jgi:hypothetical protein